MITERASGFAWYPSEDIKRASNWSAFIASESLADYAMLERKAAQDPEWFWDALIRFLGVKFVEPYARVLDLSKGIEWPQWCVGATGNMTLSLLDRHATAPPTSRNTTFLRCALLPRLASRGTRIRGCGSSSARSGGAGR